MQKLIDQLAGLLVTTTRLPEHKAAARPLKSEGDDFFDNATLVPAKQLVTIRLDADVIEWLKRNGKGYQTRANKILRTVMESQQRPAQKKAGAAK